MSGTGSLGQYNLFGQGIPQATQVSQGLFNNPYAGALQAGAGVAGPLGQAGGLNAFGAGGGLYGAGGNVLNTAFDPQSALYSRTLQQLQDQVRTANAAAGVGTTPYGAGLEGQALSNFNIDWQNQQLQRQLAGLGGAGAAFGQAQGMQAAAPGQYMAGAGLPYSTFQGIGQGQLGALSGLGQFGQQAAQIPQQQIQDYSQYALGGQGTALQGGQLGLNQAQLGWQQTAGMGQGLGWGLGALANSRFGQGFPSWGGGYPGYTGSYGGTGGGLGGLY
jgi:hypothetical protein